MTDSQDDGSITITSENVTLVKQFEPENYPVPSIAYQIESDQDDPVKVKISEAVPAEGVEDIGFHPEYGSEYWSIYNGKITFEKRLGPNESYTTIYGVRECNQSEVQLLLTEPAVFRILAPVE